jgi:periplasmic protein TonB
MMDAKQILSADIDDIIFEGRNKEYGAYDIRKKYRERVNISLLIAITILVLILLSPEIVKWLSKPVVVIQPQAHVTTVNELAPPPPLENTPPPPPTYIPPPPKTIVFTPPKVVHEVVKDEPPPTQEEVQKTTVSTTTNTGTQVYVPPNDEKKIIKKEEPEPIYEAVDEAPEFPGGYEAFKKYVASHINYPESAKEAGVQGTVYIRMTVSKTGAISEAVVVRDPVGYGCGAEAAKVIRSMPPWKPGKMGGNPVSVHYTVPVTFVLK